MAGDEDEDEGGGGGGGGELTDSVFMGGRANGSGATRASKSLGRRKSEYVKRPAHAATSRRQFIESETEVEQFRPLRPRPSVFKHRGPQTGEDYLLPDHLRQQQQQQQQAGLSRLDASHTSPAKRLVRFMARSGIRESIMPTILMGAILLRWLVALWPYSGQGKPPRFGDFEAQRHWMELTIGWPIKKWYSTDLDWWGLDYPPLTAYVSWVCGQFAYYFVDPAIVAPKKSRGIEGQVVKAYMRATVLVFDLAIFFPAAWAVCKNICKGRSRRTSYIAIITVLFVPALILIDHGHFQYNCFMLGLSLASLWAFQEGRDSLGAFFFTSAILFKHMALYYSPVIFGYLLGKCFMLHWTAEGFSLFIRVALVTAGTILVAFSPFLTSLDDLRQVLHRLFPFERGVFEDKVANLWCVADSLVKVRRHLSTTTMTRLSAVLTLIAVLPPLIHLVYFQYKLSPARGGNGGGQGLATLLLPYAMLSSSLAFFLVSFQVHEKHILLPVLPALLLMVGRDSSGIEGQPEEEWWMGGTLNIIAVWSMMPLLAKEGLAIPAGLVTYLWTHTIGYSLSKCRLPFLRIACQILFPSLAAVTLAHLCLRPPARTPDIYPLLNVVLCAAAFSLVYLWSLKRQLEVGWAISGMGQMDVKKTR